MKIRLRQGNGLKFSLFPDFFLYAEVFAGATFEIFRRYIFRKLDPDLK